MLDYATPALARKAPRWLVWYLWLMVGMTGLVHVGLLLAHADLSMGIEIFIPVGLAASPYLLVMMFARWCSRTQPWNTVLTCVSAGTLTTICAGGLAVIVYVLFFTPPDPQSALVFLSVFVNQMILLFFSVGAVSLCKGILMYATRRR